MTHLSEQTEGGLRAYHGKQEIKDKYLQRMKMHINADELIHGTYWQNGKGCAIGCTVETNDDPHSRYPIEIGIPEWLAYLEDSLFESLPNGQAKEWPIRFLEAIPVGADLGPVLPKFCLWLLVHPEHGVLRLVDWKHDPDDRYTSKVKNAVTDVANLFKEWVRTGSPGDPAAWSAAWSAQSEQLLKLLSEA